MVVAEIGLAVSLASLVLNPGSQTTVARRTTLPVGFKPYHQEEEKPGLDLPILYTRLCESVHFFLRLLKRTAPPNGLFYGSNLVVRQGRSLRALSFGVGHERLLVLATLQRAESPCSVYPSNTAV